VPFCSKYERGAILVKISILKGKGLEHLAEPPRIKFIEYHPRPGVHILEEKSPI